MIDLLLTSSGEWFKVLMVIGGLFAGTFLLATVYGSITEKAKVDGDTAGCGWPIFLIVMAIIIGILINAKGCSCKGSSGGGYDSDEEYWENTPRHT